MEKNERNRLLIALGLIIVVGLIASQGFLETSIYVKTHILIKYSIYFFWLLLVAAIGWWGWKNHPQQWIKNLWLLSYSIAILLLLGLGVLELFTHQLPLYYKKDISQFRAFFLSPVVIIILYLLAVFSKNNKQ